MLVKAFGGDLQGIDAITVTIEVATRRSNLFVLVGLPDATVKEAYERVNAAVAACGFKYPRGLVVNMAPADVKKEGSAYDLPIAIAGLAAMEAIKPAGLESFFMMGELGLDGAVRPVRGVLPMAIRARADGFKAMIVPAENAREAAVVDKIDVYGVNNLSEVIALVTGADSHIAPTVIDTRAEFARAQAAAGPDFADVRGQENVKRAFEVACAGGHNLLMVGPPGSGKSMMAKRIPSILPPLTLAEALQTTKIHSVAGKLGSGAQLMTERPFRTPHHTVSPVALVGGGTNPMPGEISLAHNGVLFLDEFPEFPRAVLEVLRQPLEDRTISVSRAKYSINYPAGFMLVASMNPCPCGYYTHPTRPCTCQPGAVARYKNRISGPLLDRIDIQCEILPVPFKELSSDRCGESSADIRARVVAARAIQSQRYADIPGIYCNAQLTSAMLRQYCPLTPDVLDVLRRAMTLHDMSARAYDRILKVARTIADLDASPAILPAHIREAISYRTLDRSTWGAAY